jgi:hypothetical protein
MRRTVALLITLALVIMALPATVRADTSIYTHRYVDGKNIIMMTHNVRDVRADVPIAYNMRVYTLEGHALAFEQVQVLIKHDSRLLFGKSLMVSDYKDAAFTYAYPKRGTYTLSLRFTQSNKILAAGDFPIVVDKSTDEGVLEGIIAPQTVIAFLLGIGITRLYAERRRLVRLRLLPKQTR